MRIAVSGLSRSQNPQPGPGVISGLRSAIPGVYVVGLAYDSMESGVYAPGGPDRAFTMVPPTCGAAAYLNRLDEVRALAPFDVFIPTLDAEIELLVHHEESLRSRGIKACLPLASALRRCIHDHLPRLAGSVGVDTPETRAVYNSTQAFGEAVDMGLPLVVKGSNHGAHRVDTPAKLTASVTSVLSVSGAPVLLQKAVVGPEFSVMGIGDGAGGISALCPVRYTMVSHEGTGLGGVTVRDEALGELCGKIITGLKWRGAFEIDVIKDESSGRYCLTGFHPRFPSWVDFPARFGLNFAAALARFAETGLAPRRMQAAEPGWFYLRHQMEVTGRTDQLAALSACGTGPAHVGREQCPTSSQECGAHRGAQTIEA